MNELISREPSREAAHFAPIRRISSSLNLNAQGQHNPDSPPEQDPGEGPPGEGTGDDERE